MCEKDSKTELEKAYKVFTAPMKEEDVSMRGTIHLDQLRRVCQELNCDMTDEELEEMIRETDKLKKGFIDEEDFFRIMKKANLF